MASSKALEAYFRQGYRDAMQDSIALYDYMDGDTREAIDDAINDASMAAWERFQTSLI